MKIKLQCYLKSQFCNGLIEDENKICRLNDINTKKSLIHPSHLKYDQSRRLPYLALINRLKAFIRNHSSVLVISGYSFGNSHLNDVIMDGLESNPTVMVVAFAFGNLEKYELLRGYAERRANLTVFADDLCIAGKGTGVWMADNRQNLSPIKFAFSGVQAAEAASSEFVASENTDVKAEREEPPAWAGGNYRSRLGDFAALGEFLTDISGSFSQVERATKS